MNPYESPSLESGNDQRKWFRRRPATVPEKQRAIRVLVAINCGLIAYVVGGLAFYHGANSVLSVVKGNGWIGTAVMMHLLMEPLTRLGVGILGGITGYVLAKLLSYPC